MCKLGNINYIEEKSSFPKDFFSRPGHKVSTKEALNGVTPIKWSNEVLNGKKKVIVESARKG